MKKKFESNVATQVPQTQMAHEPQLPWEIRQEDFTGDEFENGDSRMMAIQKAPMGIKPVFLIVLLVSIFVFMLCGFLLVASQSKKRTVEVQERMQQMKNEKTILLNDLQGSKNELEVLKEKTTQLEKTRDDLSIQNKELITVIKTLTESDADDRAAEEQGDGRPKRKR